MSKEKLKKYGAEKRVKRQKIMKKIEELAAKRAAYIKAAFQIQGSEKGV
ncbi:MAG: hypothetical protein GTO45_03560 [Candidatus Aminicenantes bacterium]|nr:hypothetical protein [Candidatus Aminicenantes bacterium]NIN17116.1 hypothetical protein [Candidatus Aminicenantes bacterium]NIN41009.1 hypothetical protein [Candidatus Aminicenantes bacterium]NIN83814.1 hypothetical protein [Candidatus Aminicenantes bacterium]NIO79720.1 hypothetical protein [Candidatus Aminicenantes bacterium]